VNAPLLDQDARFIQAVEQLTFQKLIAKILSLVPASRQAIIKSLPCDVLTSISRNFATICSGLRRIPPYRETLICVSTVLSKY